MPSIKHAEVCFFTELDQVFSPVPSPILCVSIDLEHILWNPFWRIEMEVQSIVFEEFKKNDERRPPRQARGEVYISNHGLRRLSQIHSNHLINSM